jgi:hypothetical protein
MKIVFIRMLHFESETFLRAFEQLSALLQKMLGDNSGLRWSCVFFSL